MLPRMTSSRAVSPAHVVLTTFGSLGDLHPYLALGVELRRRGHRVTIATHGLYRGRAEAEGLGFAAIRPDYDAWGDPSETMRAAMDKAKKDKDTLGGVVELRVDGLPPGLGSYVVKEERLDARIAWALMGIQAVKSVEIGDGLDLAHRRVAVPSVLLALRVRVLAAHVALEVGRVVEREGRRLGDRDGERVVRPLARLAGVHRVRAGGGRVRARNGVGHGERG